MFLFLVIDVKAYSIILLLFVLSFGNLYSQDVSKIDLNNVNVDTKRLPTIFLFGEEFTARDRDELLRGILKSQFHKPDLEIVINLQEFISKRSFSFRHKGSVDVIIDGKRLRNQNRYNNTSLYSSGSDTSLVNLINEVTNVRIDSNINGILKRRVIRKELKSIEYQISKFMENIGAEFENDTLFVNIKSQEKALKKFYRIKNRHEKKLNETKLIEINIITN